MSEEKATAEDVAENTAEENAEEAPREPMNRAERRAQKKGKLGQQQQHHGAQKISPHGSNHGPSRQVWNRKSG